MPDQRAAPPPALRAPPDGLAGRHARYDVDPTVLTHGGRAVLHRVNGGPLPLVYKAFKEPLEDERDIARLDRLVAEGRTQFIARRRPLGAGPGAALNWPIDMVLENGQVLGVLLPRVPPPYERPTGSLRSMEFLILHRGEAPPAAPRVAVLLRLAELLAWLAERSLVHGDVAPRNVLWSCVPRPEVLVLDVDGIHDTVAVASEHVATPGWTDPRVLERLTDEHDLQSDWYALGLFMYRGLLVTPGMLRRGTNGWPRPTLPPDFFPTVGGLLHRALDRPLEADRPRPQEWVDALLADFFPDGDADWDALDRLDGYAAARRLHDRRVSGRLATVGPAAPVVVSARSRWRRK